MPTLLDCIAGDAKSLKRKVGFYIKLWSHRTEICCQFRKFFVNFSLHTLVCCNSWSIYEFFQKLLSFFFLFFLKVCPNVSFEMSIAMNVSKVIVSCCQLKDMIQSFVPVRSQAKFFRIREKCSR